MADSNPFSAPQTSEPGAVIFQDDAPPDALDAKYRMIGRVVVTWERLRLLYNAILAGTTLLLSLFQLAALFRPAALITLLSAAIGANACFTAGPLVDGYLSWFGVRHRGITVALFVAGVIVSIVGVAAVLFSLQLPNQP